MTALQLARKSIAALALALGLFSSRLDHAQSAAASDGMMAKQTVSLTGVWSLVRCDNVYPDGRRVELYGPDPQGQWIIDATGNYSMMIVRAMRGTFAAGDKSKGTPDEYRAAALDFNAHFGHLSVEGMKLHVHIDRASFPNWDGRDSTTSFTINNNELTYIVNAPSSGAAEGAKGEVVWRREPDLK
jgi:hypothetical protein